VILCAHALPATNAPIAKGINMKGSLRMFSSARVLSASDVVRGACLPVAGSIGEVALYTTKMEQAMIVGITFAMKINTALKVI